MLSRDFEQIFGQIVSIRVKTSVEYLNAWNRLDGGLGDKTIF